MPTIDELNALLVTLNTALMNVASGNIQEYSIGGRRVVYKKTSDVLEAIASIKSQISAQSAGFTYAGFGNPE